MSLKQLYSNTQLHARNQSQYMNSEKTTIYDRGDFDLHIDK